MGWGPPLIQEFRKSQPGITQPWYVYDYGVGGTFKGMRLHIDDLMVQGTLSCYFPEPTKSILVVSPQNIPQAEAFFRGYRLQILIGIRYLGGFLGSK